MNGRKLVALLPLVAATNLFAQTVAPPYAGTYSAHVLGSVTGLPTSYGGLTFKAGDPQTILIGGHANDPAGRFYEVPVVRSPVITGHISGFGTPVAKGFGANNDGGISYGPGGVLFYSKYNVNQVGQVRPGSNAEDKTVSLGPLGVAVSPGALAFVPPGFGGAGRLKLCSYSGGQFYDVAFAADGSGTYNLSSASQTATLANGPEGFIYAPAGSPLFPSPTLLVTEYGSGKIAAYDADANGNPVVSSRRDFLTGLTGGEGATIDPVTGDFLFSTFGSTNRVVQVRGFNPPPPAATVTVTSSANPSYSGSSVTLTATVTSANGSAVTGTVTFKDNGTDIAGCVDVAVSGGAAACTTSSLVVGSRPIVAFYGGNATNAAASGSLTQTVLAPPPGGVGGGLRLWLDADDTSTLFGDAACTSAVAAGGSDVACWKDKSASRSDVVDAGTANGVPTWLTGQFNGRAALQFSKTEADTLRHVLATPWASAFTEFIVFQQIGAAGDYDSFFSNGPDANGPYHQITFLTGTFQWLSGSTHLQIEAASNELKLYAVRGGSGGTEAFADGALRGQDPTTGGRTFAQYRVNQNRNSNAYQNSKIAEVIVYDRALTDCEMEQVSTYLGLKYGRDFFDIGSHWDFTAPWDHDVNGVSNSASACPGGQVFNSAASSIVTIDQPSHLLVGERLLLGHDGGALSTTLDVPAGFDGRLTRIWRADANEAAGMAVRVSFDLTSVPAVDVSVPGQLALLVGTSATMASATPVGGAVVNGRTVSFPAVTFQHGQYFTLAHALPPGIFVQNPGAVAYPSLGSPVVVAPNLRVSFLNPATPIDQAKVDISANFQSGADVLGILGQTGTSGTVGGLTWSWDATAGVLTLTGAGTPATYQAALRQVTYRNTSGSPSTAQRKVTFSLGGGLQFPGTGHFYEFVPAPAILQSAAIPAASQRSYFGLQGYVTTVTSQGETDFLINKLGGRGAWIGASDAAVEGDWRWITGPEGLEDGGRGRLFYRRPNAVGGAFNNWNTGTGEPNGDGDVAFFVKVGSSWGGIAGKWGDITDNVAQATPNIDGYVVEYGGLPGDSSPHLADDAFVDILTPTLTLSKAKTSPAGDVDVATNVVYTLTYQNTGAAAALNVVLHDAVPAGATFVSATGGGTLSGSTVTWDLGTVAAGAPAASVTVTIKAPATTGTITNSANVSAANAPQVNATATVTLVGPTLTLQKTGPAGVAAGRPITWTITYGNTGTGSAASPVLVDTFPAGTSFVSAVPVPTSTTATTATWNLAAIAPAGSGSVSLTLNAPAAPGTITNSAQLSATAATSVAASAASRVTTCANASVPCLTKAFLPGTVQASSETSTLTFALENGTDGLARTVSFTDTLPAGLELAASPASPQCGGTVTGTVGGSTVTVANATLGPGQQSCSIAGTVRGTTAGAKVNDASRFSGTGGTVDVSGASATLVVTQPVLGLTKTAAPASVVVSGTVTYSLVCQNTGTVTATSVQLVDPVPAGATFVSASGGGVFAAGSVTWSLGSLKAGEKGSVTVTVRAPGAPATLTNTATLSAANAASAQASASVSVFGEPKLALTLIDTPDPALADTDLHYTLSLTNTGTLAASGTTLSLPLPAGTSFVSATGGGVFAGGAITWSLGALAVGQPSSVSATVHVLASVPNGSTLTATATANASNLTPPPATATAQTSVISEPKLQVDLAASPEPVQAGGGITYQVAFSNPGTAVSSGTTLTLTVPGSTTIQTVSGGGSISGPTVTWTIGSLLPGQSGSHAVTVGVDTGVPNGTVFTAASALASSTTCGTPAAPCRATDDASTTVTSAAVLALTKNGPSLVRAGSAVTYELRYGNTGNLDAQGVVLSDPLPPNTFFVSATGGGVCQDAQTPPGPCSGPTDGTYRVVWNLGTLRIAEAGSVFVTLGVVSPLPDGTPLVNTASLESTAPGGPRPATAQTSTLVASRPAFTLTKKGPLQVSAGGLLLYTLEYRNVGTDSATGVVLTDQLPSNTTFVSAGGGGALAGSVVTWSLGTVPAGVGGSVSLVLGVASPLPNGTLLANNASLRSNETPALSAQAVTRVLSAPLPRLSKSSSPSGVVAAGGTVTYTLEFANDGNEDLLNAVLTDQLPLGIAPVAIGGGGTFDAVAGTVTWDLGTVPAGTSGSHVLSLVVPLDTPNGTILSNTATLRGDDAPPLTVGTPLAVTSAPVLGLTKSGPAFAAAGSALTWTLAYSNTGNATATNVVLTDQLPAGTSYVSASGAPAVTGGLLTWTLGDLPPGSGGTLSVTASVNVPAADGTLLTNTASLDAANASTTSASALTRVTSSAVLELSKSGPAQAAAGSQFVYRLSYRNVGTDVATAVVLTDQLPPSTTFVSATGGGTHAAGVVTWNLGAVGAGVGGFVDLTVSVASPLPNGTRLVNRASLQSATTAPVASDVTTTVVSAPILSLTKTASPSPLVAPGAQVLYTITIRNDGNENSLNTQLLDLIPPGTSFVVAVPPATAVTSTYVSWNVGTLAAGQSLTYQMTVQVPFGVPDGTSVVNAVSLYGDDAVPATGQVEVRVAAAPALRHTKTPSAAVASPGQNVSWVLEYQNVGSGAATGATVVDQLPPFTSFVSASGGGVWNAASRTVTWNVGGLAPGSGGSVMLTLAVDTANPPVDGAILTNTSFFDTNETPSLTATAEIAVSAPVLVVSKSASPDPVSAGSQVAWLIQYRNAGTGTATGATITDPLAPELAFVSLTGSGSYDAGTRTVTWTLPPVAPGAPGSVSVLTRVAFPLANGTLIRNDAFIDSLQTTSAAAPALATVQSAPLLTLTKTANPDPISPGGVVTYTLTALNAGNDDATRVTVVDRLPVELVFVSASAGGVYDPADHTVTWDLGTVAAGSGPTFLTLQARVLASPGTVTNTAEISSFESPTLAVSSDVRVEQVAQITALSLLGLAALALALALAGARLLRGWTT